DVHQARVATRRLRSDLRTFLPVADEDWAESLRDELAWLGGLLGAVRDTDVLLERLHRHLAEHPDVDQPSGLRLLAGLHEHRHHPRAALLDALRSERYVDLLDRLFSAARRVPGPLDAGDLDVEAVDLAQRPWRKLRSGVRALGGDPPDPDLHQIRIRAKRCRY